MIETQTSCAYTPEQNDVAKCKNQNFSEVTVALDAVLIAAFLINRMPSTVLGGKSPIKFLNSSTSLFSIPPKFFLCMFSSCP